METVVKRTIVPFTQEQIYSLINDIQSYPDFLPFCDSIAILERHAEKHITTACMTMCLAGLSFPITTINTGTPHKSMDLTMVKGPFRAFHGLWTLLPLSPDSKETAAQFQLTYDLGFNPATLLIAPLFRLIADQYISAFIKRAEALYGS